MEYSPVRRVAAGQGRDFIVGDIHGAFHLLMRAIDEVGFDPRVDRLFSVGDLVDRGLYSPLAGELLRQPWLYAVRGNHEQLYLDLYANGMPDFDRAHQLMQKNGMLWWLDLPFQTQMELLTEFSKLPVAMEVETTAGRVGIVHAEVPLRMDWPTFIAKLEAYDSLTLESALWGRKRVESGYLKGVPGIDRVFVGHTIHLYGVQRLGNVVMLDTGAFISDVKGVGKLSVAQLDTESSGFARPKALRHVDLMLKRPESIGLLGKFLH